MKKMIVLLCPIFILVSFKFSKNDPFDIGKYQAGLFKNCQDSECRVGLFSSDSNKDLPMWQCEYTRKLTQKDDPENKYNCIEKK